MSSSFSITSWKSSFVIIRLTLSTISLYFFWFLLFNWSSVIKLILSNNFEWNCRSCLLTSHFAWFSLWFLLNHKVKHISFCENHYFEQANSNRIFNIIINIKEVSMIILNLYLVIFSLQGLKMHWTYWFYIIQWYFIMLRGALSVRSYRI